MLEQEVSILWNRFGKLKEWEVKKNLITYSIVEKDTNKVIENFIILDKEEIELLIDINFYLYDIDG